MRLGRACCFVACLSLMARAAEAIDFDPAEHYQTLRTPHFLVVHPDGYERLAHRAARIAESAFERQTARYGWDLSGRVTIVLDDRSDSASGGAQISPSKTIYVSVAQPTSETSISDYDDWMETIIAHELAHVFHLDMVYGLPWVARQLFGKSFSLNGATAAWNTEGLGVYEETVSSGAGRGRSTYGDMVLRMAALDDAFPGIDEAYYEQTRWPWAGTAYLFGGRFQLWLAERYGEEALVHYHRAYASTPIPFVTWLSAKLVFGRTLESLWQEFGESVNEEARATFEAVESSTTGVTRFTRLTSLEGDAIAPRVTPDGLFVVFSHLSPFEGETVRVVPVEGGRDTILLRDVSSRTFGFGPDGSIYFHRTDIDALYSRKDHLERYDFVSKSSQALVPVDRAYGAPKRLERSSDPDVSRSGRHVAFVQRHQGQTQLVVARLSAAERVERRTVIDGGDGVEISTPRFSPDGTMIVASRFSRGRRDIVLYDRKRQVDLQITHDRAQDIDPIFSPDGRWILFSSDRNGIYNVYAYDLSSRVLSQVTNVVGGAFSPSLTPNQSILVFRGYSSDGFDVYATSFTPESARIVGQVRTATVTRCPAGDPCPSDREVRRPPALARDLEGVPPEDLGPGVLSSESSWSTSSYSALDTLLPFHDNWNLKPSFSWDQRQAHLTLLTEAHDPLDRHRYSLFFDYGTGIPFASAGVSYSNLQTRAIYAIGGQIMASSKVSTDSGGERNFADYRKYVGSLSVTLPVDRRHSVRFELAAVETEKLRAFSEPFDWFDKLSGTTGTTIAALSYHFGDVRWYPRSVSYERGYAAEASLAFASSGGESWVLLRGEASFFGTLEWFHNQVLVARLGFLTATSPRVYYPLGGDPGHLPFETALAPSIPLRGLVSGALEGPDILYGGFELRAPLVRVDRGLGTTPFVLRVLHAAMFADGGLVSIPEVLVTHMERALSVGAELRADFIFWHELHVDARVGYAYVVEAPRPSATAAGPYFQIGAPF